MVVVHIVFDLGPVAIPPYVEGRDEDKFIFEVPCGVGWTEGECSSDEIFVGIFVEVGEAGDTVVVGACEYGNCSGEF